MSFRNWLLSNYPNPRIDGQFGLLHIISLLFIVAFIVTSTILLRKTSEKTKRKVVFVLAGIILFFEIARRVINLCKTTDYGINNILKILLPRPGCAISCWLVIIAVIVNKKYFYNFTSIIGILCGLIFFIYPGTGYNNEYILFENAYSIITHTLFFTVSICFITYKFTDFKYKTMWKELICLVTLIVYVFLEIYVLKIEPDPFYFMPGNDVQKIVGFEYNLYLPCYIVFAIIFVNLFYFIPHLKNKKAHKLD